MADVRINVKIKNAAEIRRAFGMAPTLMSKNLNKALKKSLLLIERDSRRNTPVDTGRLRASHRTKFSTLSGELSTNVSYATFVHEGTRYMRARPFMRRAVSKNEPEVNIFMKEAVEKTLNEIGKRT